MRRVQDQSDRMNGSGDETFAQLRAEKIRKTYEIFCFPATYNLNASNLFPLLAGVKHGGCSLFSDRSCIPERFPAPPLIYCYASGD
jgi:hypothetical protein